MHQGLNATDFGINLYAFHGVPHRFPMASCHVSLLNVSLGSKGVMEVGRGWAYWIKKIECDAFSPCFTNTVTRSQSVILPTNLLINGLSNHIGIGTSAPRGSAGSVAT